MKFHVGMRIKLKADPDEGWEAQEAQILGIQSPTMLTVAVKPEDEYDDGVREVTVDQVEGA